MTHFGSRIPILVHPNIPMTLLISIVLAVFGTLHFLSFNNKCLKFSNSLRHNSNFFQRKRKKSRKYNEYFILYNWIWNFTDKASFTDESNVSFLELQILDFKIVVDHNWIEQIAVDHYSVQIAVEQTVEVQSRFPVQLSDRNDC